MGILGGAPISGMGGASGAGQPVVSTAPAVGASAPTSNLLEKLMMAMHPASQPAIAKQLADAGMSPDRLAEATVKGDHLAKVIQPSSVSPSGKPYDIQTASPDKFMGQNVLGDMMKPAGSAIKKGAEEGVGKFLNAVPKGQAQANPLSGIFNRETATPSISESMQPQRATERVVGASPPTWRGDTAVPGSPTQQPIQNTSPGQLPIAPPVLPPEQPQTLPEALKRFLTVGNTAAAEGFPQKGTSIADTVVPNSARAEGTVAGGTSPTGSLSPLGGQLLQPRVGGAPTIQPEWSGTTSYQLHGGATRSDALKGMNPELMTNLEKMYANAPPEVQKELGLTSAYRDIKTQGELYNASDRSGSVAKPGHSEHNFGNAVDLYGFGLGPKGEKVSGATRQWVTEHAKEFGMGFTVKGEPWHLELLTPEGKRMPLVSPGTLPNEIAQRGEIPQIGLKQRDPTAAQGMSAVRGLKPEYRNLMASIGQAYGVDPSYLQRVAMIESGGNPNAVSPTGAKGLMQFTSGTAKQYRLENPNDPKDSIRAASELAMDNAKSLEQALGRKPSWAEVYLAHQQGSAGAAKLLKNPDGLAVDTLGRDAVVNNGGTEGMTNQEFANLWIDKYNGTGGDTTASTSATGEQFGPTYTPGENPLNKYPAAPGIDDPGAAPLDMSSALDKNASSKDDYHVPPPGAVAPSQGSYRPDADMMKLMMMMLLAGGGGGAIPSIGQLMSGQGGGGRGGQANG